MKDDKEKDPPVVIINPQHRVPSTDWSKEDHKTMAHGTEVEKAKCINKILERRRINAST